jgi:hypothetical protein
MECRGLEFADFDPVRVSSYLANVIILEFRREDNGPARERPAPCSPTLFLKIMNGLIMTRK